MVRYEFEVADLSRLRFAISPMWELVISLRALRDPATAPMHVPWIREARVRVKGLDRLPLLGLVPIRGYIPDLLTPPPTTPLASFEEELELVRAAPVRIREEVKHRVVDGLAPALAEPFLRRLTRPFAASRTRSPAYWAVALEPYWSRVRALLEADLLHQ